MCRGPSNTSLWDFGKDQSLGWKEARHTVMMQGGHMKLYFCSRRHREYCLSDANIINRQASIFRSVFGNCCNLRLHGHRCIRTTALLFRRTGGLRRAQSASLVRLIEVCTHNILSVSFKTLQVRAPADENSHDGMQLIDLRQGEREPVHVFIGLWEISSSVNLKPNLIDHTGIPFRSAIILLIC